MSIPSHIRATVKYSKLLDKPGLMLNWMSRSVGIERNGSSSRQVISEARELPETLYSKDRTCLQGIGTAKVKIKTRLVVQNPKVAVSVQPPLAVTQDLFIIDSMGPGSVSTVTFGVFLKNSYPPAELGGAVAVSYSTPTELNTRFEKHFAKQGAKDFRCSFAGPIPLQEYFEKIDRHFELRLNSEKYQDLLSERAVQFRAIQRRLLTRFKDKTPAPLQNLDTLMDGTYRQVRWF
ncbi:UNVERIFIED_CONTAM: hypothetical protein FKN15_009244 [Acipenser sinensis]